MAFSYIVFILLPQIFQDPGVWGAKLRVANNCSDTIWPAIVGQPGLPNSGFQLFSGNSVAVQAPSTGWTGRLWGRTGCTFNSSGYFSCITGNCGRIACNRNANNTAATLVEFTLGGQHGSDFYDISLVDGYNLPVLVKPTARCASIGCTIEVCPPELRSESGRACRSPCQVFNTSEYCCRGGECGPTNYSRVLKRACPTAYSYPFDDANTTFACTRGSDYFITFCPASSPLTGQQGVSPAQFPPSGNGTHSAQSPGFSPTAQSPGNGKISTKVIIIIVLVLSITAVITVSIMLYYFLKRRHLRGVSNKDSEQYIERFLLQHGSLAPKRYKYSEMEKITESFKDKLGKGGYGSVYKGMLPNGCLVAVKDLIETDSKGEEFINEVASISRTSHVNIVSLLGFCYEGNKRALVYEYMPNKSLDKFLSNRDDTNCILDMEKLYKIAVGIAKGLEYLHTGCNTRIVHFDIKPQNILLDDDFCPKISDFGLAKLCKKKQSVLSLLGTRGTIGYIAPEMIFKNLGGASHKSDVYSYGMMILEMGGARKNVEVESSKTNYFPDEIYEHVIDDVNKISVNLMIGEEEETRTKMLLVGFWCIQTTPADRPSISKVVEMLEGCLHSIQIPPKPVLFSSHLPKQQMSSSFSTHLDTQNSAQD